MNEKCESELKANFFFFFWFMVKLLIYFQNDFNKTVLK